MTRGNYETSGRQRVVYIKRLNVETGFCMIFGIDTIDDFWKAFDEGLLKFQNCFDVGLLGFSKIWLLFVQTFW